MSGEGCECATQPEGQGSREERVDRPDSNNLHEEAKNGVFSLGKRSFFNLNSVLQELGIRIDLNDFFLQ